jgi:galactoside O-acetyltransferase
VSLIGHELIQLDDFVGVSARTNVYSSTDDYSGEYLTNPTVPDEFKHVIHGAVVLEKHALVGAGCVILPGVRLGLGCCVGALSLVNKDLDPYGIYVGIPAKWVKERSRRTAELEEKLLGR